MCLMGLIISKAYEQFVKSRGGSEPILSGLNLTHEQIFFASFAQVIDKFMHPVILIFKRTNFIVFL